MSRCVSLNFGWKLTCASLRHSQTALHSACAADGGQVEVAELLINRGVDMNAQNNQKRVSNPIFLCYTAMTGRCLGVRAQTALCVAVLLGFLDVVTLLVAKGANIRLKDRDGKVCYTECIAVHMQLQREFSS